MTPKEKATELLNKYRTYVRTADTYGYLLLDDEIHIAKGCASTAVKEILKSGPYDFSNMTDAVEYWEEVKKEIELL